MRLSLYALIALLLASAGCNSSGKAGSAWLSPSYRPTTYKKIIVLAKISDDIARRQVEDETVFALRQRGYGAIPSYSNITDADLVSEQAFVSKAESLGADALIAYTGGQVSSNYKPGPTVNAGVGVPVRVGFFNVYLGANMPIGGGGRTTQTVHLNAAFYDKSSMQPQWQLPLNGSLQSGTATMAKQLAGATVRELRNSKILR